MIAEYDIKLIPKRADKYLFKDFSTEDFEYISATSNPVKNDLLKSDDAATTLLVRKVSNGILSLELVTSDRFAHRDPNYFITKYFKR